MDAGRDRRQLSLGRTVRRIARASVVTGALALGVVSLAGGAAAESPRGRTIDYWIAAVPVTWNIVPNGRDAIANMPIAREDSVMPTVVYRRFGPNWRKALANAPRDSADGQLIPGPLLQARVGDHLRIHFKNMDTLRKAPHSMHFHGVHYKPSSDGAYVPGFSGRDGNVKPGQTYTYRLDAGEDSAGVWPYHDHSPSMMESIDGGMYGMLSILGRNEKPPDHEFEVVLAPMGQFMTIDGRAFVGNTPVFRAKVGDLVQWDVMALGSDFHTFHVHGHRWITPGQVPRDTQTVGPAESFRIRWREDAPGTWLYHCHVEDHMMRGMIGIYRVSR
jgi:FtsP/CotA-like multicopper oxidase with cupredoxin domain